MSRFYKVELREIWENARSKHYLKCLLVPADSEQEAETMVKDFCQKKIDSLPLKCTSYWSKDAKKWVYSFSRCEKNDQREEQMIGYEIRKVIPTKIGAIIGDVRHSPFVGLAKCMIRNSTWDKLRVDVIQVIVCAEDFQSAINLLKLELANPQSQLHEVEVCWRRLGQDITYPPFEEIHFDVIIDDAMKEQRIKSLKEYHAAILYNRALWVCKEWEERAISGMEYEDLPEEQPSFK